MPGTSDSKFEAMGPVRVEIDPTVTEVGVIPGALDDCAPAGAIGLTTTAAVSPAAVSPAVPSRTACRRHRPWGATPTSRAAAPALRLSNMPLPPCLVLSAIIVADRSPGLPGTAGVPGACPSFRKPRGLGHRPVIF